jgi:hypothetical protein
LLFNDDFLLILIDPRQCFLCDIANVQVIKTMQVLNGFQCRKMIRLFHILFLLSTILRNVESAKNDHPYAFEKPLTEPASFMSHKLGLPFVERKTKFVRKEETEFIDEDSDRSLFEKSDRNVMERDRTSSAGEIEIRSRIVRNSTNSVDKKRDQDVIKDTTSVDKPFLEPTTNDSTSTLDLSTSQSIPVAQSLRGNKDSLYRLKNKLKSELSKPVKPIKHKPDYDDDEYYYTYDDDEYYYEEAPPPKSTKMSNSRKNFESKSKLSSSYYKKPSFKDAR